MRDDALDAMVLHVCSHPMVKDALAFESPNRERVTLVVETYGAPEVRHRLEILQRANTRGGTVRVIYTLQGELD